MKRLFVGIQPPPALCDDLASTAAVTSGVRWVPSANLHLTLAFFGNVSAAQEELLRSVLLHVRTGAFMIPLRGMGCFGGAHPSVLWVGVGNGHPLLFLLHRRVSDAAIRAGLEPDLKPFHPHITMARVNGAPEGAVRAWLRTHKDADFGMWRVDEFRLFSSAMNHEGSDYIIEETFPLA